jgi:hypothetical protein
MKSTFIALLMALGLMSLVPTAHADWRWAEPALKQQTVKYHCATLKCIRHTYIKERKRLKRRIARYNQRRLHEWKNWSRLYIPNCTWYGESGTGPQFARYRYTTPNSTGSGAYGKYQMMPGTYHSRAKYHDWSPLDQEIAAHREYWAHGTSPWTNCY